MAIEKSVQDMTKILRSIVIKVEVIADFMNQQISNYTNEDIYTDKRTWAYYMNLAGDKHFINTDVVMSSLDTGQSFIMTKDSIKEHPTTLMELRKFGAVFDYVVGDNGAQDSYIRGMINPMDMETVIAAPDLSVLYLDPLLMDAREDQLIADIEVALYAFFEKWYTFELSFENRYIPTLLSQLYAVVAVTIINSRISTMNTEKASMEDIYNFLNSSLNTADVIPYLDKNVLLWLYANIRELMRNVSKDVTLQSIIENVMLPSGIDVFDIKYISPDIALTDSTNTNIYPWARDLRLVMKSRDPEASNLMLQRLDEDEYLKMQTDYTNLNQEDSEREVTLAKNKTVVSSNDMLTKSLVINNIVNSQNIGYNLNEVIIENWLSDSLDGTLVSTKTINLEVDGTLTISARDSAILFLHLLMKKLGLPDIISGIKTSNVIKRDNLDDAVIVNTSNTEDIKGKLRSIIPTKAVRYYGDTHIDYGDTYFDYITEIKRFHMRLWILKSSASEETARFNADLLSRFMFYNSSVISIDGVDNSPVSLKNILVSSDIRHVFNSDDVVMDAIYKAFTNVNLNLNTFGEEKLKIFVGFLKKFISYNVQILSPINEELLNTKNRTTSLIRGIDAGLILDFSIYPLGDPISPTMLFGLNDTPIVASRACSNEIYSGRLVAGTNLEVVDTETLFSSVSGNNFIYDVGRMPKTMGYSMLLDPYETRLSYYKEFSHEIDSIGNCNTPLFQFVDSETLYFNESTNNIIYDIGRAPNPLGYSMSLDSYETKISYYRETSHEIEHIINGIISIFEFSNGVSVNENNHLVTCVSGLITPKVSEEIDITVSDLKLDTIDTKTLEIMLDGLSTILTTSTGNSVFTTTTSSGQQAYLKVTDNNLVTITLPEHVITNILNFDLMTMTVDINAIETELRSRNDGNTIMTSYVNSPLAMDGVEFVDTFTVINTSHEINNITRK